MSLGFDIAAAGRSPSPRQPKDWEQAILEAESRLDSVGFWLLSDAHSRSRLFEAARSYDERLFSDVVAPLLAKGAQGWATAARQQSQKLHEVSLYIDNNHESLSEWLYLRLNGKKQGIPGQVFYLQEEKDRDLAQNMFRIIEDGLSSRLSFDNPMQHIEAVLENLVINDIGQIQIDLDFSLREYVNQEMDEDQTLGTMMTFTGSISASWATTCKKYLQKMWPEIGTVLLRVLEDHIKSFGQGYSPLSREIFSVFDGDFGIEMSRRMTRVKVQGSKREIVQTAQALTWMMSAFQTRGIDHTTGRRIYSSSRLGIKRNACQGDRQRYQISPLPLEDADDRDASCWLPLLHGGVIAHGFPIPERGQEVGVEMSLDAIVPLAGIQYPVHIKDVTVFRGWRTLLFPTKASTDFGSIQWHLATSREPDDKKLLETLSAVKFVKNWRDVGPDSIRYSRCFVGYCKTAKIHIATEDFEHQKPRRKSGATVEKGGWFWGRKVTVNMGTSGMGAFGFGAGLEMTHSRTARASMAARDNFKRVLDLSQKTPVVLYDVKNCIGWMVSEISVVLHITRSWFLEREDIDDTDLATLPFAEVDTDGGTAAMEAILFNEALELPRTSGTSKWSFFEAVKDSVRILKACRESNDSADVSGAMPVSIPWFQNPKIYGWDLADAVDARDHTPRKEIKVHKNSSDKWIKHIAQDPSVLVLFCRNIAPPIRPAYPAKICRAWNPIPSGQNYLVTPIRLLRDLANHCNGGNGGRKLTDKCYWCKPSGSNPWKSCDFESDKGCKRLQQVVETEKTPPKKLWPNGAVIFGYKEPKEKACLRPSDDNAGKGQYDSKANDAASNTEEPNPTNDDQHLQVNTAPDQNEQVSSETGVDDDQTAVHEDSDSYSYDSTHGNNGYQSDDSTRGDDSNQDSFREDCRALILALAAKLHKHPTPADIEKLIKDGQEMYVKYLDACKEVEDQKEVLQDLLQTVQKTEKLLSDRVHAMDEILK